MNTDIVMIDIETRNILAIIMNSSLKDSISIAVDGIEIIEVDNTKPYMIINQLTGVVKYKSQNNNILYLEDYKKGGHK